MVIGCCKNASLHQDPIVGALKIFYFYFMFVGFVIYEKMISKCDMNNSVQL